ncbi:hypothetical protein RB7723 [Rhodopirellula baltica SH 1]|uniref:Uncharacterized protein n=1 Tax=Rhodopirellula baltica (strain DSM 10527 / NCIMB 13988 / SH1) TaxID=243090 RepID=Q7UN87_RHOBA|nr:hypothetical protein RB7723 [Rhodopirellula baltica SH 1]
MVPEKARLKTGAGSHRSICETQNRRPLQPFSTDLAKGKLSHERAVSRQPLPSSVTSLPKIPNQRSC